MGRDTSPDRDDGTPIAGGGLLGRRTLLKAVGLFGASMASAAFAESRHGNNSDRPTSMRGPGKPMSGYGLPAPDEAHVERHVMAEYPGITPGAGVSFTPLEALRGRLTPNGLHFERHHSGIPAIDPQDHRLLIHGLVKRPLVFTVEQLLRYPQVSQIAFLECSGNSFWNTRDEAPALSAGRLHGLLSCSEWTGVPVSYLLDEAGLSGGARWVVAEGADAAGMVRSIPLEKLRDDAILAMYQNGERLRPEQGYPVRLFLPGFEGNTSVKWLRRLKLVEAPVHSRDETSKYADLLPNGQSKQFTLEMEVKSIITAPSGEMKMPGKGTFIIEGIAWSGAGRVRRVEISADAGRSWAEAVLEEPIVSRSLTRFRMPWRWEGATQVLMSRATDETGAAQPARTAWRTRYHSDHIYHYNAIQSWRVGEDGSVSNVYG